jgi:glycosyltransferase involved in cell wall biosynthesis
VFENNDDQALFRKLRIARNANDRLILGAGVDTSVYYPSAEEKRGFDCYTDNKPIVFLFASRFLYSKGLGDLIAAVGALNDDGYNCVLRICGFEDSGNPDAIPSKVLEHWSRLAFVDWLGQRRDMSNVLKSCDVVVLPTSYGEGVPRILIEAAASGKPCVATDIAGCREIIIDGVNGTLIRPEDPLALREALKQFVESPQLISNFGKAGRNIVLEKFDQGYVNADTVALYESLI